MAVNYPNNPTVGDEFTLPSGIIMVCEVGGSPAQWKPKPEFKNYLFPVSDVLSLRSIAGEFDGQQVSLTGYYAGSTKGGGNLVWDATSTAADDGGVTFAVAGVATGRWLRQLEGFVTPEMFGCTGSAGDELARMQAAFDYSVSKGIELRGSKSHTINGELSIGSGLKVSGSIGFELIGCSLRATGGLSAETALTLSALSGETQLTVDSASGYGVGDYIRIISCINAQSPAAGRFFLGDRRSATDITYLSEFAQIRSISGNTLTLQSSLVFDYALTPDADSGSRTITAVYKVNFIDNVEISNLRVQRTATTTNEQPLMAEYLGPNCKFNNVKLDCSAATYTFARPMQIEFCYKSKFTYCDFNGIVSESLTGSAGNTIVLSCQEVEFVRCYQSGGNQGIDVTAGGSTTVYGGPSIRVKIHFCEFTNTTTDGATSHWGCYQTEFYRCNVQSKSINGIRVRSRGDKVIGCNIQKGLSGVGGSGVFIAEIPYFETEVYDNTISGYTWGVRVDNILIADYTISDLSFVDFGPLISRNSIESCSQGVYVVAPATSRKIGVRAINNKLNKCNDGVRLGPYSNYCKLKGNHYYKSTNGVYIEKNSIGTIIRDETFEDCTARAIRGSTSGSDQVLDTTTFGVLANAGFSITENYYINSPAPASMSTNLTGLVASDWTS